jgi:hypothetical protein
MQGLAYWNDQVSKGTPRRLRLVWNITGAKAFALVPQSTLALVSADAITQADLDAFLGTASEVDGLAFDATAMGNDTFGGVVDLGGQAAKVVQMSAVCFSNTGGSDRVERQCQAATALTNSTNSTQVAVTSQGNLAFRAVFGNTPDFDGLTSGTVVIDFDWISK